MSRLGSDPEQTVWSVSRWGVSFPQPGTKNHIPCVQEVGFSLAKGSCLGVVGPSGSGKSVSFQSLLGLYEPRRTQVGEEAKVALFGNVLQRKGQPYRSYCRAIRPFLHGKLGVIFQEHRAILNPLKTVHRHFQSVAKLLRLPLNRQEIQRALLVAGCPVETEKSLASWLRRLPHQLSGGELQRLQIALTLYSPHLEILVCDEVTSNLDAHNQWRLIRLLQRLNKERGLSIVFISHHWEQVQTLSDHILVMTKNAQGVGEPHLLFPVVEPTDPRPLSERFKNDPLIAPYMEKVVALPRIKPIASPSPVVSVSNLHKSFQGKEALKSVSLSVFEGETYGLIGESGSGKSTLARMILGIEDYSEATGSLEVLGHSRSTDSNIDTRIQMVFQNFSDALNPHMTALQHLDALIRENDQASSDEAKIWTQNLNLAHCLNRRGMMMSGGEKRRLGLVEAFSLQPSLVLADEPTSGLDRERQTFLIKEIERFRQDHPGKPLTVLLISHDLALVGAFSDRIGVLFEGNLVQEGLASVLLSNDYPMLHPYTELLLHARTLDLNTIKARPRASKGCCYYHRCHRADVVDCAYQEEPPPVIHFDHSWSLCPYAV
jgi:ABC-type dipeptide/oligopeptide/nickel transport system ATPase subunit